MRARTLVLVSLAAVAVVACGASEAASRPVDGTLRLEIGGAQGSLREALSAAGVPVTHRKRLRTVATEPQHDAVEPPPSPTPQPPAPAPGVDKPAPPVPPAATFKIVVLERNQTLIHLAKIHLGNGNRFREILAANGWTEDQARRLAEGTKVKVPIADGAGNGKR